MFWRGTGLTDRGRIRFSNQDTFAAVNELGFWVVADGMGGHAGGDVASRLAVDTIVQHLKEHLDGEPAFPNRTADWKSLLQTSVESANQAIQRQAHAQHELQGMGTTVVLLHIPRTPSPQAMVAHVGDSRAYLLRHGSINCLTQDHTWVEEQIRLGTLTPEQASYHSMKHVLTRAVGIDPTVEPDFATIHLEPEDRLLLCTDGLSKMLTDQQIVHALTRSGGSLEASCQALIDEANHFGGEDNVTVVLIERDRSR